VSGSLATKRIRFCRAKSLIASPTFDRYAGQKIDFIPPHQFFGGTQRDARLAFVVPADDLQLSPEQASTRIQLFDRQLPAATIGQGKRGRAAIGVDLADPDRSRALGADDAGRKHRRANAA